MKKLLGIVVIGLSRITGDIGDKSRFELV